MEDHHKRYIFNVYNSKQFINGNGKIMSNVIIVYYLGFPFDNFKLVLNASIFFQYSKIFASSWEKSMDSGTGSTISN